MKFIYETPEENFLLNVGFYKAIHKTSGSEYIFGIHPTVSERVGLSYEVYYFRENRISRNGVRGSMDFVSRSCKGRFESLVYLGTQLTLEWK